MKIDFDDGSFLTFEPQPEEKNLLTISMCGITNGGKKATMSTSTLSVEHVEQIIGFLAKWKNSTEE